MSRPNFNIIVPSKIIYSTLTYSVLYLSFQLLILIPIHFTFIVLMCEKTKTRVYKKYNTNNYLLPLHVSTSTIQHEQSINRIRELKLRINYQQAARLRNKSNINISHRILWIHIFGVVNFKISYIAPITTQIFFIHFPNLLP